MKYLQIAKQWAATALVGLLTLTSASASPLNIHEGTDWDAANVINVGQLDAGTNTISGRVAGGTDSRADQQDVFNVQLASGFLITGFQVDWGDVSGTFSNGQFRLNTPGSIAYIIRSISTAGSFSQDLLLGDPGLYTFVINTGFSRVNNQSVYTGADYAVKFIVERAAEVPEPTSIPLVLVALGAGAVASRRRRENLA